MWAELTGTSGFDHRIVSLPSGASVVRDAAGNAIWSYTDLRGHQSITGTGGLIVYDPFGQTMDPATGTIGATVGDAQVPDSNTGEFDRGWYDNVLDAGESW